MLKAIFFIFMLIAIIEQYGLAQSDTSKTAPKLAFEQKLPDYTKGHTVFYMDAIYKEWNGRRFLWGFYDMKTDQKTTDAIYDTLLYKYNQHQKKGYYIVKEKDKMGLLHSNKTIFIPIKYDKINYVNGHNQSHISIELNQKFGVLDTAGKELLQIIYDEIAYDGFRFLVHKNGAKGLFSTSGKELIPLCFDQILYHNYVDQMQVRKEDKWSIFNWIKEDPCAFQTAFDHVDGMMEYYVVRNKDKFAMLDKDANSILPFEYDFMAPFFVNFLRSVLVGKDKKVGVLRIDSLGKVVTAVPILYNDVWVDQSTLKIKVRQADRIDYYFEDNTLFDLAYNDVQYYHSINRVMVKKGKKWGMLTPEGATVFPIQYDAIHLMNKRQFMVKKGGKWGLLDAKGNELIPILYDEFDYRPKKDIFFVKKGKYWGIVSTTKGLLLPAKYEDMVTLANRSYLVQQKGKWGIVAAGGRVIVPLNYTNYQYKYKAREVILKDDKGGIKRFPLR